MDGKTERRRQSQFVITHLATVWVVEEEMTVMYIIKSIS